jgi:hypothetical protein
VSCALEQEFLTRWVAEVPGGEQRPADTRVAITGELCRCAWLLKPLRAEIAPAARPRGVPAN